MTRGLFDLIASTAAYRSAEKYWHITLDRSEFFWYELVVNPPEFANSKQAIVAYLDQLRDAVKETLEKRFIYFYLSRTKVRFNTRKQPHYSWFGGKLNIHLLIGRDQMPRTISIPMPKHGGRYFRPIDPASFNLKYANAPSCRGDESNRHEKALARCAT